MIRLRKLMDRYGYVLFISIFCIGAVSSQDKSASELRDSVETLEAFPAYEDALPIYKRINELSKKEGDRDNYLYSKLYVSFFNQAVGNFIEADEDLLEAFLFVQDTTNISSSNVVLTYQLMQDYERTRGNLTKANDINKQYIKLEQESGSNDVQMGISYLELGAGYRTMGDFENAILYTSKSIELFENADVAHFNTKRTKIDRAIRVSKALQIRGLVYKDMKAYKKAIGDYTNSLRVLKKSNFYTKENGYKARIDCNVRLAHAYILNDQLEAAEKALQRVPALIRKIYYQHYRYYELLALLTLKKEQPTIGLRYIDKAIELCQKELGGNREFPEIPRLQMIKGDCYLALNALTEALEFYQDGLQYFDNALTDDIKKNPDIVKFPEGTQPLQLLEKKADALLEIYIQEGDLNALSNSISTYNVAIHLLGKMKADFINEGSKYRVAEMAASIYEKAIEANYILYDSNKEVSKLNDVCNIIEKNKAEILFQNISSKYNLLSSELSKELINEGIDLKYNISYYSKLLSEEELKSEQDQEKIKKLKDKLFTLNESLTFYDQQLKDNFPDFYKFKNGIDKQADLASLKDQLDQKQIIIEYFQTEHYLYALSFTSDRVALRRDSLASIDTLIELYYQNISSPPSKNNLSNIELNDLTYTLSNYLILNDPNFSKALEKVIIIPDGVLTKIPFETLRVDSLGKMLIEQCVVTYNYSANQFYENQLNEILKNPKILSFAPSFGGQTSEERSCRSEVLGELPYAQNESTFLQSEFQGKFLVQDSANIRNLKKHFAAYPIVHLATHACVNEDNPMLSQIFFSNGTLTNYDIQNLNARPELVILSACNTASGQIRDGEGVIGLSRGFFEAGVKGMQSSLWSINDLSSSQIVTEMYAHLKKGQSKSEALRNSKLDFLDRADKLRSHPYYWSAIIHIGNDNPIEFSSSNTTHIWYLLFVVGLIIAVLTYKRRAAKLSAN